MASVLLPDLEQSHDVPFGDKTVHLAEVPELDPSLYSLSADEAAFFKSATGIEGDEELRAHILSVQEKAWRVAPYGCIHVFGFLRMAITKLPVYQDIIKIGRERENAIFVDVGCCLSTESRRVAADGFPACNIVAFDLKKEFLQLSHVLFRSTKETYPGHFIAGDALDPAILDVAPPARGSIQEPPPDLSTLTSLNPLRGHCSVINASAFFSCFSEELQLRVARAVGGLLSPVPGSIICGYQPGAITKGKYIYPFLGNDVDIFCHSPETWMELWNGTVFAKGEVEVATHLAEISVFGVKRHVLMWSVRRL